MEEESQYSISVKNYFNSLNKSLEKIYSIGQEARKKGFDPSFSVEIPIAKDIADRVEGLIGPKGVGQRIRELEQEDISREKVAFIIAKEIAEGKFFKADTEVLAEQAIRTSLAIITESITAAPLEGIAKVKIKNNDDGTQYLAVYYAGPIRSAGGTAAGMSVLLADQVRRALNLDKYKPSEREIERMLEEIDLYNRVMHLQLPTTKEEQRFAAKNLPIEITGEPTESVEVSGNRDIKRIETNRLRGGACLVFNDGIVGRAKKLQKRVKKNSLEGWDWFSELIKIHTKVNLEMEDKITDNKSEEEQENKVSDDLFVKPDLGYIQDVIGGRPVFSHPSAKGGFRIRYGRSRITGLAAMGIHPALMALTDDFLVCGTHVRTERPGKGAIVMPVDSIHPPIVRLKNGDVIKVNSYEEGKKLLPNVDKILFIGDMLYGVGEFNQFNYDLVPSGYCEEWWAQELENKLMEIPSDEINQFLDQSRYNIQKYIEDPINNIPEAEEAILLSLILEIPLHPAYTYHWNDITISSFLKLREYIIDHFNKEQVNENYLNNFTIPFDPDIKKILEEVCIPHTLKDNNIHLNNHSKPFLSCLGFKGKEILEIDPNKSNVIDLINSMHYIKIRDKAPIYTGARMGRPEKAKERKMKPPIHALFPIGEAGGRYRNLFAAEDRPFIKVELVERTCPKCENVTHKLICEKCGSPTKTIRYCDNCGISTESNECPKCHKKLAVYSKRDFAIAKELKLAKAIVSMKTPDTVKAVKKMMNKERVPEHIVKGILRAINDVFVYRDGTIRFDATDAVLTHFKPIEVQATVAQLKKLGYSVDINGNLLQKPDQIVELKVQDVIVNIKGGEYLLKVSKFIDDLLEKLYGLPRFYNAHKITDLIGHLIIGLAPHTSAGIIGRIVGFSDAKVTFAHPYWHAAKRRNCLYSGENIVFYDTKKRTIVLQPIGDMVEKIIKEGASKSIVDDFETLAIENTRPHIVALSINEKTNKPILQPIKHYIKAKNEIWVEITTKSGRTIKMTDNHNALIYNSITNKLEKLKAINLKIGDQIPVISKFSFPVFDQKPINILQELSDKKNDLKYFSKSNIKLLNAAEWLYSKLVTYIKQKNKEQNVTDRIILDYLKNILIINYDAEKPDAESKILQELLRKISFSHLETMQLHNIFEWDEIPKQTKIILEEGKEIEVFPSYLKINSELMHYLGYIIAGEVSVEERDIDRDTVYVETNNNEVLDHVKLLIQNIFGGEESVIKIKNGLVGFRSKIFSYVLDNVLFESSDRSQSKKIPEFVFTLPNKLKWDLLSAIIDISGIISTNDSSIVIPASSKNLVGYYIQLLSSLGVYSSVVNKKNINIKTKSMTGEYGVANEEERRIHGIKISFSSLQQVLNNVKLITKSKHKQLNILNNTVTAYQDDHFIEQGSPIILDTIKEIEVSHQVSHSYCLEVKGQDDSNADIYHNIVTSSNLVTGQCDGDEDSILLALDAFLNFSKFFLPEVRGGMMDAPLILVSNINPFEVDDESHNVDTANKYPLAFYEKTLTGGPAKNVLDSIDIVSRRLNTPAAYEGFLYSHETNNIFTGVPSSAYARLGSMREKVEAQLELASRIRAVDVDDVATKVIFKQFIPDLIGNMRRFGSQKIRCTNCNTTFRRIPLSGVCPNCGKAKLNLTVHEGSVTKYISIVDYLVSKYKIPEYLVSRIELIKHNFYTMFGDISNTSGLKEDQSNKKDKSINEKSKINLSNFLVGKE